MKVVAIIAEYNPFHYGHLYQINKIKEQLGDDCAIIAIMSGNFTQRGEIAVADKVVRASSAVMSGVDLVLELPFPYSISSAEFFASAGVYIASSLGIVDYLAFGSEIGDTDKLCSIADVMLSDEFSEMLSNMQTAKDTRDLGYPKLCQLALESIVGENCAYVFSPNNILAIEYIKAIKRLNSKIKPFTVKRYGSDYNNCEIGDGIIQSASAIRELIRNGNQAAFDYIPDGAREILAKAHADGLLPTLPERLDIALISHIRINPPKETCNIHDTFGGLYNRLHDVSHEATSISSFISLAETKKFTNARIRRALWCSYLGVTSSDVRTAPAYAQVLGLGPVGRTLLKKIKKSGVLPLITKPSSYIGLSDEVKKQKELSDRADSVFYLAHSVPRSGKFSLKFTPYVKEE